MKKHIKYEKYEVGKVYEKTNAMEIGDKYLVFDIKELKSGTVIVYFKWLGCSRIHLFKESFMIGSKFDKESILSK